MVYCKACDREVGIVRRRHWIAIIVLAILTAFPVLPSLLAGLFTEHGYSMHAFAILWIAQAGLLTLMLVGDKVCGICRSGVA